MNDFKYERSVRGIVERIAYQLSDAEVGDEYDAYDETWITARVQDTFKWLQGRRPDLFAHQVTFDLKSGSDQEVPEECDKLLEVLSVESEGKDLPALETQYDDLKSVQVYDKLLPACALDYCVYQFGISDTNPRRFLISPPVSPNKPVSVTANCSDMNRFFEDKDLELDCDIAKWINTVIEYVMYQALSIDSDNPISESAAERHRSTFFDLAPVKRRDTND